ncbi:uncharacterized protein A4U43_C01F17490 [Asparagus officinalis]|uniref:BAG domain-containing protein n=1 Tax=Asparagus officinalis TaxID=4686 RepID=A0A5P1FQ38_ASPOF|nr:uncharacterized protein A4U43_C01F17490 [Asparagus officinalis]
MCAEWKTKFEDGDWCGDPPQCSGDGDASSRQGGEDAGLEEAIGARLTAWAVQVSDVESTISKGKKVADEDLSSLIEQLMTQLVKLDAIVAEGDLKLQKRVQIRRIQKYVETLDLLKIKNAKTSTIKPQLQHNQRQNKQQASIVVTAEWEMFDSLFGPSTSASSSAGTSSSSSTSAPPRSDWELF